MSFLYSSTGPCLGPLAIAHDLKTSQVQRATWLHTHSNQLWFYVSYLFACSRANTKNWQYHYTWSRDLSNAPHPYSFPFPLLVSAGTSLTFIDVEKGIWSVVAAPWRRPIHPNEALCISCIYTMVQPWRSVPGLTDICIAVGKSTSLDSIKWLSLHNWAMWLTNIDKYWKIMKNNNNNSCLRSAFISPMTYIL